MKRFVERLVASKPATKIGLGTGIIVILYFICTLCTNGFSFAALVGAVVSVVISIIFIGIIMLAVLMILDGLLSTGE